MLIGANHIIRILEDGTSNQARTKNREKKVKIGNERMDTFKMRCIRVRRDKVEDRQEGQLLIL